MLKNDSSRRLGKLPWLDQAEDKAPGLGIVGLFEDSSTLTQIPGQIGLLLAVPRADSMRAERKSIRKSSCSQHSKHSLERCHGSCKITSARGFAQERKAPTFKSSAMQEPGGALRCVPCAKTQWCFGQQLHLSILSRKGPWRWQYREDLGRPVASGSQRATS